MPPADPGLVPALVSVRHVAARQLQSGVRALRPRTQAGGGIPRSLSSAEVPALWRAWNRPWADVQEQRALRGFPATATRRSVGVFAVECAPDVAGAGWACALSCPARQPAPRERRPPPAAGAATAAPAPS